jgi:hypothetical protein
LSLSFRIKEAAEEEEEDSFASSSTTTAASFESGCIYSLFESKQ